MDQGAQDPAVGYRWTFSQVEFDETRWELRVSGQPVELERKPLELLAQLLRHAGEVLTKDELLESVWTGRIVVEAALTNAVGKLRKAMGDDAQRLIVTVPRVGYRLDGPVSRKAVQALPPASVLSVGDAVPRRANYRLVERLARNEASEVWRAEQPKTHEVRVFKFSLDGTRLNGLKREVTLSRLLRDALGERPEFVRVLDWDFAEAPFFIESEFGGTSLDSWFEQHSPTVDRAQRLALMAEVADAVASAHEVGVLHKDLKPANILIYGEDGALHARLTDFGSGRVLDEGYLDSLGITQLGLTRTQTMSFDSGSATPLYLAPEVLSGHAPSVKSDLYALGVILYQLLVGDFRRPLFPGWESGIDDELLRQDVCDFANGDPSKRPGSARALSERLRSLAERHRRLDLERSVQDRIDSNERRLAKVRARRPWAITAFALLVLGLGATLHMYREVRQSQERALLERDTVVALNEFVMQDILAATDPMRSGREGMTMREALDLGAGKISTRFASQPALAGPMHESVAGAYYQLSDYAAAHRHFQLASRAYELSQGGNSLPALRAHVVSIDARVRGGVTGTKRDLEAAAARVSQLPERDQPLLWLYLDRARAQDAMLELDFRAAIPPLDHAVTQLALLPEVDPMLESSIHQARTIAYAHSGLRPPSLPPLPQALEANIPMKLSLRYAAARVRMIAGEERLLEDEYREIVHELSRTIGPGAEATLLAQHGLSHIYYKQEKWHLCEPLARRTAAALGDLLGEGHVQARNATNSLASCLVAQGRHRETQALLGPILLLPLPEGKAAQLLQAAMKVNLAHAEAGLENWKEVGRLVTEAKVDAGKLLSIDSDGVGEVALLESQVAASLGDRSQAEALIELAIAELKKKNPEGFWAVQVARRVQTSLKATPSVNTLSGS